MGASIRSVVGAEVGVGIGAEVGAGIGAGIGVGIGVGVGNGVWIGVVLSTSVVLGVGVRLDSGAVSYSIGMNSSIASVDGSSHSASSSAKSLTGVDRSSSSELMSE